MSENTKKNGLTGSWYGNYYYSSGTVAYAFEAVLLENDGALTGNILDAMQLGEATVTGHFAQSKVEFTKVYYKGTHAPVQYEGTLSEDGKSLCGTWSIVPMSRGTWIAWRIDDEEGFESISDSESIVEEKERHKTLVMPSS